MTFKNLQDDLIVEVEGILSEIQTKNTAGEKVVGVKGYAHQLPVFETDEEDVSQLMLYFIVRFDGGETKEDDDPWHVATQILFSVHDDSKSNGHEHLLTIIQRVVDRFVSEPLLNKMYRADQDIQFAIAEDDTYPFYFGGISMKFSIPKIGRREPDYV